MVVLEQAVHLTGPAAEAVEVVVAAVAGVVAEAVLAVGRT